LLERPLSDGGDGGTTAHAIGTLAMLHEGKTQGAMSGDAFPLDALMTAVVTPFLIPRLIAFGAHP
jgi:putative effector of murein hydrolase